MDDVEIRDESIRLGQFLKLAGAIASGSDAKPLLGSGAVSVNGEVEIRRGRQLRRGDVVTCAGRSLKVAGTPGTPRLPALAPRPRTANRGPADPAH